jgi:hypothetical protein
MAFRIVPIVEGHGEVQAVPVLLRRLVAQLNPRVSIEPARSIRQARGSLLKEGGIESAVSLAAIEMGESGAILILLDSEGECPRERGPELLARAQTARPDKSTFVVLAHQEFEAWFLASASSLKGQRGLSEDVEDHHNPESVRGCKEWLEKWMPSGRKYSETADQAALAAAFDMALARQRSSSFDKLWREIERICQQARAVLEEA